MSNREEGARECWKDAEFECEGMGPLNEEWCTQRDVVDLKTKRVGVKSL